MGFVTQRLANGYPPWSRIRKDPSSVGQRLLSCFADIYDSLGAERVLLSESFKLFSERKGTSSLYWVNLEEEDFFVQSGYLGYTYPTVTGTLSDGTSITLTRSEDSSDFFAGVPTRISSFKTETIVPLIWQSSSPSTYNKPKSPCRIGVTVSGSTHFKTTNKDKGFGGYHIVIIKGYDENHNFITDGIRIEDDGTYKTEQIYSEVTSIDTDGFNGTVTVFVEEFYPIYLYDKFHPAVSQEFDGPLFVRAFTESTNNHVGLELYTKKMRSGEEYRRDKHANVFDPIDLEEIIDQQMMLDPSGAIYSVTDYTISPIDGRLWTLSSTGDVYIHDNTIAPFGVPTANQSSRVAVEIVPDTHRIALNETVNLWTWYRHLYGPVKKLFVKRIDPAGTVTYLQSDKTTWSSSVHYFQGDLENSKTPEESWNDIRFKTTATAIGEWHFYCEAHLLAPGKDRVFTSHTGFMCGHNKALKKYTLGLSGAQKIFFSKEGYLSIASNVVANSGTCTYYKLANDKYFADVINNRILLKEDYAEVEVTSG